jgi:hypothetical protein
VASRTDYPASTCKKSVPTQVDAGKADERRATTVRQSPPNSGGLERPVADLQVRELAALVALVAGSQAKLGSIGGRAGIRTRETAHAV